jgi:hypothetical protein
MGELRRHCYNAQAAKAIPTTASNPRYHPHMRVARFGAIGVLAVAACTSPLTPSQFVTDEANAFCAREVQCGAYADTATCLAVYQPKSFQSETVLADIADKKIAFSSASASGCVDYYESLTCEYASIYDQSSNTDCSRVTTGTVGSGGACFYSEECVPGFACAYTSSCDPKTACCSGTCVADAPVAIGSDCSAGQPCMAGAYCSDVSVTCVAVGTTSGAECEDLAGCASPMLCMIDENSGPTGTCMTPPGHGETCNPAFVIACGLETDYCDSSSALCTSRIATGSACAATDAGCVGYDVCSNGTCVTAALIGSACTVDPTSGASNCVIGTACSNGTCVGTPAGSACM